MATANSGAWPPAFLPASPRIGGTIARVGNASVEVLVGRSGWVEAWVSDAEGKPISSDLQLSIVPATVSGESTTIELGFDARRRRFVGHAQPGIELASGPLEIAVKVEGEVSRGELKAAVTLLSAQAGGYSLAVGRYGAEVLARKDGVVEAVVRDFAGELLRSDSGLKLTATLRAKNSPSTALRLGWDAARRRFRGQSEVELSPGYLELALEDGLSLEKTRLENVALAPKPAPGRLLAVGNYCVTLASRGQDLGVSVFDAYGNPYPAGHLELMLAFGGESPGLVLPLRWDAQSRWYEIQVARAPQLVRQPVRVSLTVGVNTFLGAAMAPANVEAFFSRQ